MLASGRVAAALFVPPVSPNLPVECSDASADCGGSVIDVSFAACAGAPVATVSGTPGSPPIVPGSFRPQPARNAAAAHTDVRLHFI